MSQETGSARLLVLNGGSTSFKWTLFGPGPGEERSGQVTDADQMLRSALAALPRPDAVGHRVVHGGHHLRTAVHLDADARSTLAALVPLAPLHQSVALRGIDCIDALWPGMTQIACFDTAFHATLPDAAARYALPPAWVQAHHPRRFGAHGLSVEWAVRWTRDRLGKLPARMVVCHLGGGTSMTAVKDGVSLDTTMGFTPLEGPAMSTRSGSIDPGLLLYLLTQGGISVSELSEGLQRQAGLLGLSGISGDLRLVHAAALEGNAAARAAIDHVLWTQRRAVGAMGGVLGGVDAVVFTGGVGEHQPFVRSALAAALPGCMLDDARNQVEHGDREISVESSATRAFVVSCREDRVIRDHMRSVLAALQRTRRKVSG